MVGMATAATMRPGTKNAPPWTDKHAPFPLHLPFASGVPPGAVGLLRQAGQASSQTMTTVDARSTRLPTCPLFASEKSPG
jgi:hypothetical protein